ncbi:hypothetical protein EC988_006031, partial [Linderina pennispora]
MSAATVAHAPDVDCSPHRRLGAGPGDRRRSPTTTAEASPAPPASSATVPRHSALPSRATTSSHAVSQLRTEDTTALSQASHIAGSSTTPSSPTPEPVRNHTPQLSTASPPSSIVASDEKCSRSPTASSPRVSVAARRRGEQLQMIQTNRSRRYSRSNGGARSVDDRMETDEPSSGVSSPIAATGRFSEDAMQAADTVARRPLTPQISSSMFLSSVEATTERRRNSNLHHRHHRHPMSTTASNSNNIESNSTSSRFSAYQYHDQQQQQPLTPPHMSTSSSSMSPLNVTSAPLSAGAVSTTASSELQQPGSPTISTSTTTTPAPRPPLRMHAASIGANSGSSPSLAQQQGLVASSFHHQFHHRSHHHHSGSTVVAGLIHSTQPPAMLSSSTS